MFVHRRDIHPSYDLNTILSVPTGSTDAEVWDSFGRNESDIIRAYFYQRQNGRCAYCEEKITIPEEGESARVKIEHFHPRKGLTAAGPDCTQ